MRRSDSSLRMSIMSRFVRTLAALAAIAALLFSQLALAAHACERVARHSPECGQTAPVNDEAPSNLCMKHCQDGKASVDMAKPLTPIASSASIVSIPLPAPAFSAQRPVSLAIPHPPPPTFAARSSALRI